MSNLFDQTEDAEADRLYFAGCVRHTSPFSGAEYWLLPDGARVAREEALAWLKRKEACEADDPVAVRRRYYAERSAYDHSLWTRTRRD